MTQSPRKKLKFRNRITPGIATGCANVRSNVIEMTRAIADACRPPVITIHDHIIIGSDGVTSFKALGLL